MPSMCHNLPNERTGYFGMSDEQIAALWGRVDEHGRAINDLSVTQQVQAVRLASQEERFERYLTEQASAKAEILEAVRGHHKREGVKEFARLLLPWLLALGALVGFLFEALKP